MENQLRELVPFLHDRNPQVRQIALSNLLSQTPTGSPHRNIFFAGSQAGGLKQPKENEIIRDLKILCRDQLSIAHDAFRALVNLSDSPSLVASLSEPSFLNFLVSYILNPEAILADLASMLLSNLTASSSACSAVLALEVPLIPNALSPSSFYPTQSRSGTCTAPVPYPSGESRNFLALPLLVDAFVQGAQVDAAGESRRLRKGELHFLSSVFANLSVSPAGRNFFLTPKPVDILQPSNDIEYPLAKIVSFTEHKDTIRRGGVISTLKNCAFNAPAHRALLSPDSVQISIPPSKVGAPGVDILPALLLPLAGPEEFDLDDQEKLPLSLQFLPPDKKREPDSILRLMHVETLLLLCTTRWGRDFLRDHGTYEIVRAAHEVETVDKISEHIERLVTLLKGDEALDGETEHDEVFVPLSPKASEIDSEDEDNKIEEV